MKKFPQLITIIFTLLLLNSACQNQSGNQQIESSMASTNNKPQMETDKMKAFAEKYAESWCSQKPESVAAFFSNDGSLKVNNDSPAVGRDAITKVAQGFMTAFPDMIVSMDSLVTKSNGIEFHWTLTGTNTGPNGTGKKVRVSGYELWQIDGDGLIRESIGSFDADEYNRQLKFGMNK